MMLTNTQIKNAKPGERAVKLFDGRGLYLEIAPSGGKLWRLKYRFDGKEKRLALGRRLAPTSRIQPAANGNSSQQVQFAQAAVKQEDPFFSVSSPTLSGPVVQPK